MTTYLLNQPVAGDDLSISQPKLAANCNALDTIYGFDHIPYSNTSATQGLHNTVTTPAYQNPIGTASATPPATTTYPIFYGFQPSAIAAMPLLQYSRGTSNAVPSPVTTIQSPATPLSINSNATVNLLDFAGATNSFFLVYAWDTGTVAPFANAMMTIVQRTSAGFIQLPVSTSVTPSFGIVNSGSVLQLKNTSAFNYSNVFWAMQFIRIS